ncbi:hypothetical protein AB0910_10810 [Streptomyces sp. NPDC047002]|uniref:hypothetical protein n=1 Tax=Streptomyces sp. NPDC047002 TaxID=3155475 RepID=UPI0034519B8E
MGISRPLRYWGTATATAGLLLAATGAAAAAAPHHTASQRAAAAPLPRLETAAYQGVQGINLCLLARCSLGGGTPGDTAPGGVSNTQGGNLCLLAVCSVGPE